MIVRGSTVKSSTFQTVKQVFQASVAALLLIACSDGGHSDNQPPPAAPVASSAFGITARVEISGHPEQSGWVRVPPVDAQNWSTLEQVQAAFERPPSAVKWTRSSGPEAGRRKL